MSITDLLPWKREKSTDIQRGEPVDPIDALRHDMNLWFDRMFSREFGLSPLWPESRWSGFVPNVDVVESDKAITVTAELPGMEDSDIELQIRDNALVIRGEKEHRKEEKDRNVYRAERSYGSFQRCVPLPTEVDHEKADAVFKNGVLTITLPKLRPSKRKTIAVRRS